MRHVTIVERPNEPYSFVAIDEHTGEAALRLSDRAALLSLCERLGWTVREEGAKKPRAAGRRTTRHYRRGGATKFINARRSKRRRVA